MKYISFRYKEEHRRDKRSGKRRKENKEDQESLEVNEAMTCDTERE